VTVFWIVAVTTTVDRTDPGSGQDAGAVGIVDGLLVGGKGVELGARQSP
jgi:hypothetical protein